MGKGPEGGPTGMQGHRLPTEPRATFSLSLPPPPTTRWLSQQHCLQPLPLPCRLGGLVLTPSPSHPQLVTIPRKGSLSGPAEAADHQRTGTILIFH